MVVDAELSGTVYDCDDNEDVVMPIPSGIVLVDARVVTDDRLVEYGMSGWASAGIW